MIGPRDQDWRKAALLVAGFTALFIALALIELFT